MRCLLLLLTELSLSLSLFAAAQDAAAKSNNAFCFSLLERKGPTPTNDVFSPFSIWLALAMTAAGAQAETLQEMQQALHLPPKEAHAMTARWSTSLEAAKGVQMKIANRLWGRQGLTYLPDFLRLVQTEYGANLETLNFQGDPNGSRKQINRWVSEHTAGKINDLLSPGIIAEDTKLVLTNAIYFLGKWKVPFEASNTRKRDFTLATGKIVIPQSMNKTLMAGYTEDRRLQAVRLDYQGPEMAMIVVLPKKPEALLQASFLDAEGFGRLLSAMRREKLVEVQLPRFEASTKLELAESLKALGMSRAFSEDAQFGAMCSKPLKISNVIHQAWIKVAEEGTEAAAATAVTAKEVVSAMPDKERPKIFIADHPFLFFIVDRRNGGIVFAGRVMDPTH